MLIIFLARPKKYRCTKCKLDATYFIENACNDSGKYQMGGQLYKQTFINK
jgi:hypothetical protein